MKRNWKDLGEVWSGRDLAVGEVVTLNVFDKALGTLLEQISFRASVDRRARYVWVQDFCQYLNAHSALVHAGVENASGDWEILSSGYRNHYWNLSSRDLLVTSTVPGVWNWSSERCIPLHATHSQPIGTRMRLNVRSANGLLLETFTYDLDWFGMHYWPKDLAERINAVSRFVRAGRANGESIRPEAGATENWIWLPYNGDFKVSWFPEAVSVNDENQDEDERAEGEGAKQPLFVFDYNADRLVASPPLVAGALLGQAKWPGELAQRINAVSQYQQAGVNAGELCLAGRLPNVKDAGCIRVQRDLVADERGKAFVLDDASEEVLEETDLIPSLDLKAKDRVKVTISTRDQGRECETLTFTPVPNRLKAGQWHHDLALHINAQSRYVKAWVEDEASQSCVAREAAKGSVFWLPVWPSLELQVAMAVVSSSSSVQTLVAGDKKDEAQKLVGSEPCKVLWPCPPGKRAFTTLMSPDNWVKGPALGAKDFVADQQMVIRVKGSKTGRILESLVFWPKAERLGLKAWMQDLCEQVNGQCTFLRAGEANAKTFVIEASGSKDGNCFWTPVGAGFEVEAEILSGFVPVEEPIEEEGEIGLHVEEAGMTSEDRQLFEQYAESKRLISVDAQTGIPVLRIPVADFYADDSFREPLKVSLSFDSGVFLSFGGTPRYLPITLDKSTRKGKFILRLRDGRRVTVDSAMSDPVNGGDFTVSAKTIVAIGEFQYVGFTVTYKDGSVDEFVNLGSVNGEAYLPLSRYSIASGSELKITPTTNGLQLDPIIDSSSRELKITRSSEALLEAKVTNIDSWICYVLDSIVVYPNNAAEKVSWKITQPSKLKVNIEVSGPEGDGKVIYRITTDSSERLISVEMEQQYSFTVDKTTKTDTAVYKETLEYDDDGKVKHHDICPGSGMDDLVHEYTYSETGTVLTGYFKAAIPKTVFTRTHSFSSEQSSEEKYGGTTLPVNRKQVVTLDKTNQCVVTSTKVCEGDVQVDEQTLTVDALGNPLIRGENDRITRFTYYNNYQQYGVIKSEERVHNTSLFGYLLKPADYALPTGWACLIGGRAGLTWGTYLKAKVFMRPAQNNYAKDAFSLPVDIVHCGSSKPFSSDVESELVTRKVGDKEVAHSLTYFGYESVNGRIMMVKKLTVLQPNYTEVNVTAQQLKVATAAAQPLIDNLKEEMGYADADNKQTLKSTLDSLEKSLKAQSEVNTKGYKLGDWKSASMSVETYDYHTDKTKAGYGTMKSIDRVLLDKDGKAVEASRRITKMDYSEDAADTTRVVIKITVSGKGMTDVVSSQTRSRHTGRLYASVDSQGVKTVYTYDGQGNLTSETTTKGKATLRKTTVTLVRNLGRQYEQVEGDTTSRLEKDVLGRRVKMWVKPQGADDFLETWRWVYDSCGRTITSVETDYGVDNKKISERQINWTYDATSGKVTIDNMLKGADGKVIKTITQTVVPAVKGECFTQGTFSIDRAFNPATNTLTEHYATSGGTSCKIERSMSADGLMNSVRYLKVDKDKKEAEHDKITFEHDKYGQLSKAKPTLGAASAYEYDCAGRLLTTARDGVILTNSYATSTLAPVSEISYVEVPGASLPDPFLIPLGAQDVDELGRVTSQSLRDGETEFSYVGGSMISSLKTAPMKPEVVEGYSSSLDQVSRTQTQTFKQSNVDQTSKLVFSTGGRVLSFTDLTGVITTYEYDFFNRVVRSSNEHCESTFVYGDNGLLVSESTKAVKAGMTMKVSYLYDELGQETDRTFSCEGVDKLALNRDLLKDGRLNAVYCKQADRQAHFDLFKYNSSLRLEQWQGSGDDVFFYDSVGNITKGLGHRFYYLFKKEGVIRRIGDLDDDEFDDTSSSVSTPTYDAAGRLTAAFDRRVSYHANGQINTYSTDGDKTKYTFSYDTEGRVRGGTIGTKTDTYHYRGDCVYALVQSDSGKSDGYSKRTLVLRNDSRACLMQDALMDGDDSKITRSFELRDASGTVFASIDLKSKSITLFRYTPYGKRSSGDKSTTWLGFKGEPLSRTGLYYLGNGYRAYDPAWGRFLTPDSLSPFGVGGAASYMFCDGDPVNKQDPSGHQIVAEYERWQYAPAIETTAFRIVAGALGIVLAPFTAGMSTLLVVATTALAVISFSFDVASIILAESDPELARTLETWGQAFAIAGAAAGIATMVHGWKGFPRNIFKVRGGPSHPTPVNWIKTPAELRLDKLGRTQWLNGLIRGAEEAKVAGTFKAFNAKYFLPEPSLVGGARVAGASGVSLGARLSSSTKNLYTGIIRQVDDSFDFLGFMLDMNSGPNTLVSKFLPPSPSATSIVSIVGGPFPGREKLFP